MDMCRYAEKILQKHDASEPVTLSSDCFKYYPDESRVSFRLRRRDIDGEIIAVMRDTGTILIYDERRNEFFFINDFFNNRRHEHKVFRVSRIALKWGIVFYTMSTAIQPHWYNPRPLKKEIRSLYKAMKQGFGGYISGELIRAVGEFDEEGR